MNALWITCRMGKKLYLLAKDEIAYYLIEVGKNLDYATEEWLEKQGVSEILLKELQLPFIYIPKSNLRGVAITGNEAGEYIYLYLKSEKKKLMLELDYDSDWMEDYFAEIPRFTPPVEKGGKNKKDKNWRREKRDPVLYNKLAWIPFMIGVLSLGVNIGFVRFRNIFWLFIWLAVLMIPVVLDICMPGYFSIIASKKGEKKDAWELTLPMGIHLFGILCMMGNNWLDDSVFWLVIGICALICFAVLLLAEEFRREPINLILVAFLGGIFGVGVVGEANELIPHAEPQAYVLEVEEIYKSGGRHDNYYCTVTLPDSREENLNISRKLYDSLEEGDYVRVEVGEGFFGIEYANVYSAE